MTVNKTDTTSIEIGRDARKRLLLYEKSYSLSRSMDTHISASRHSTRPVIDQSILTVIEELEQENRLRYVPNPKLEILAEAWRTKRDGELLHSALKQWIARFRRHRMRAQVEFAMNMQAIKYHKTLLLRRYMWKWIQSTDVSFLDPTVILHVNLMRRYFAQWRLTSARKCVDRDLLRCDWLIRSSFGKWLRLLRLKQMNRARGAINEIIVIRTKEEAVLREAFTEWRRKRIVRHNHRYLTAQFEFMAEKFQRTRVWNIWKSELKQKRIERLAAAYRSRCILRESLNWWRCKVQWNSHVLLLMEYFRFASQHLLVRQFFREWREEALLEVRIRDIQLNSQARSMKRFLLVWKEMAIGKGELNVPFRVLMARKFREVFVSWRCERRMRVLNARKYFEVLKRAFRSLKNRHYMVQRLNNVRTATLKLRFSFSVWQARHIQRIKQLNSAELRHKRLCVHSTYRTLRREYVLRQLLQKFQQDQCSLQLNVAFKEWRTSIRFRGYSIIRVKRLLTKSLPRWKNQTKRGVELNIKAIKFDFKFTTRVFLDKWRVQKKRLRKLEGVSKVCRLVEQKRAFRLWRARTRNSRLSKLFESWFKREIGTLAFVCFKQWQLLLGEKILMKARHTRIYRTVFQAIRASELQTRELQAIAAGRFNMKLSSKIFCIWNTRKRIADEFCKKANLISRGLPMRHAFKNIKIKFERSIKHMNAAKKFEETQQSLRCFLAMRQVFSKYRKFSLAAYSASRQRLRLRAFETWRNSYRNGIAASFEKKMTLASMLQTWKKHIEVQRLISIQAHGIADQKRVKRFFAQIEIAYIKRQDDQAISASIFRKQCALRRWIMRKQKCDSLKKLLKAFHSPKARAIYLLHIWKRKSALIRRNHVFAAYKEEQLLLRNFFACLKSRYEETQMNDSFARSHSDQNLLQRYCRLFITIRRLRRIQKLKKKLIFRQWRQQASSYGLDLASYQGIVRKCARDIKSFAKYNKSSLVAKFIDSDKQKQLRQTSLLKSSLVKKDFMSRWRKRAIGVQDKCELARYTQVQKVIKHALRIWRLKQRTVCLEHYRQLQYLHKWQAVFRKLSADELDVDFRSLNKLKLQRCFSAWVLRGFFAETKRERLELVAKLFHETRLSRSHWFQWRKANSHKSTILQAFKHQ